MTTDWQKRLQQVRTSTIIEQTILMPCLIEPGSIADCVGDDHTSTRNAAMVPHAD
jgi:hypothetical protein